jgi:hypothetical protein
MTVLPFSANLVITSEFSYSQPFCGMLHEVTEKNGQEKEEDQVINYWSANYIVLYAIKDHRYLGLGYYSW